MPNTAPEYWFDSHHRGALRIIRDNKVHGTDRMRDGSSQRWHANIVQKTGRRIRVDFRTKSWHGGRVELWALYGPGNNTLEWEDGNVWHRMWSDPSKLFRGQLR